MIVVSFVLYRRPHCGFLPRVCVWCHSVCFRLSNVRIEVALENSQLVPEAGGAAPACFRHSGIPSRGCHAFKSEARHWTPLRPGEWMTSSMFARRQSMSKVRHSPLFALMAVKRWDAIRGYELTLDCPFFLGGGRNHIWKGACNRAHATALERGEIHWYTEYSCVGLKTQNTRIDPEHNQQC